MTSAGEVVLFWVLAPLSVLGALGTWSMRRDRSEQAGNRPARHRRSVDSAGDIFDLCWARLPGCDPGAGALAEIENAGFQPGVAAVKYSAGEPIVSVVGVVPKCVQKSLDTQPRLPAERVGKLVRCGTLLCIGGPQHTGSHA